MKKLRIILSVVLIVMMLFSLSVSAWAEGEYPASEASPNTEELLSDPVPEETEDSESADEGDTAVPVRVYDYPNAGVSLLDEDEVAAMVEAFMSDRGLSADSYSVAYCYTGTGETWSYNGDTYFNAASLYKLSLMMGLARKVAAGEVSQDDIINGLPVSQIETRSITYSDNDVSEQMINYFGTFTEYRLMQAEIAGVPESELPVEYFSSNTFSADFMMKVLQELFGNTDNYPNIIECMKAANPGEYFRLSMDGTYEVAQKYGGGDHWLHTAGIIYTPTPFLLVVMTHYATNAERVIADTASMFADYTNMLDQRNADQIATAKEEAEAEKLAEEEAKRAEEEAKRAAEEKAQEEAEAAKAVEEAKRAEEEAAKAQIEAENAEKQRDARAMKIVIAVLGVTLVGLSVGSIVSRARSRRYED